MSESPSSEPQRERAPSSAREGMGARVAEVALVFARLGCVSFGGPTAHIGYFHREFVARRGWIDDRAFADLVALCQFLPGPASSQFVFALGMRRAGLAGALAASLCFTLPSAALMIAFAYGVFAAGALRGAGWIHGLKVASVAVVAQAVYAMGRKLCPDRERLGLCVMSAAVLLTVTSALAQVAVIAAGAALGVWRYRDANAPEPAAGEAATHTEHPAPTAGSRRAGLAAWAVFFALLAALPAAASATGWRWLAVFDGFYRAGSLVFGGGHVVLPLLRAEVVPRGWVSDEVFLAGYGAAQAVPGPLFTFAAFLGAAMGSGSTRWLSGLWAALGVFLPAWLLIGGALPFWERLRARRAAQGALQGANAAVVGVLLAALYRPVFTESVRGPRDVAAALLAFALLEWAKAPPWLVVGATAVAGQWALRA